MKKKLLVTLLVVAGCILPAYAFETNKTYTSINIDKTRAFRDGRWKWHGYEDQYIKINLKSSAGPFVTTGYSWNWKASRRVAGGTSVVYIAKNTASIASITTNLTFVVAKDDVPPNGNYKWELLALSAGSTVVRNAGQGTLEIMDSLFDDGDGTWAGHGFTNLTDYVTKSEHIGTSGHTTLTGDVVIPTTKVLKLTGATAPTTEAEGEIGWDTGDDLLEIYNGTASYAMPLLQSETVTILQPDLVRAVVNGEPTLTDAVLLKHFDAVSFPGGVVLTGITISTSATCTDGLNFEEWSNGGSSWATVSTVEAITLGGTSTSVVSPNLDDANIAAGNYLFVDLADSPANIAYMNITVTYFINDN